MEVRVEAGAVVCDGSAVVIDQFALEIVRLKAELVSLLQHSNHPADPPEVEPLETVADVCARSSGVRLLRLQNALGVEEAQRAISATGRRLRHEKPSFWEKLDASDRFDLAVCRLA